MVIDWLKNLTLLRVEPFQGSFWEKLLGARSDPIIGRVILRLLEGLGDLIKVLPVGVEAFDLIE
jgi:hypothetical protein